MARTSRTVEYALIGLAVGVRVCAVLVLQSYNLPRSTYEHGEIAANLLAGRGFSILFLGADGPTSQQAPVYPAVVAVAYWLGGIENPRALMLLELGQSVLGGVLVLGVMRLARRIAPGQPSLWWWAGGLAAFDPILIYASTHVQVAGLATTLLVWTLVWSYKTRASGSARHAGLTGGLLALLALTDPILTLVSPAVFWNIWRSHARSRVTRLHCVRLMTVTAIVAIAGLMPWLIRNYRIHGEFVAIKSTFGYAFWQGNCALSEGTDKVVRASVDRILDRGRTMGDWKGWNRALWEARHEAGYIDDIALSREDIRQLGSISEPGRSRLLFQRALSELAAEPGRYGRLCLRRLRYFLLFDETNPKSRVLVYRVAHVVLSTLAVLGLLFAGHELRRRLMPTIVTAGLITIFHALTIVSARFHVPIEPLMAIWAAAGLSRLDRLVARRRRSSAAADHVKRIGIVDRLGALKAVG